MLKLRQYCLVATYELTSHNCGQQLPSVHMHFNTAYISAALYWICARLINCTEYNVSKRVWAQTPQNVGKFFLHCKTYAMRHARHWRPSCDVTYSSCHCWFGG